MNYKCTLRLVCTLHLLAASGSRDQGIGELQVYGTVSLCFIYCFREYSDQGIGELQVYGKVSLLFIYCFREYSDQAILQVYGTVSLCFIYCFREYSDHGICDNIRAPGFHVVPASYRRQLVNELLYLC